MPEPLAPRILAYGVKPRAGRRIRRFVLFGVLLTICAGGYYFGRPWIKQGKFLYGQWVCMHYTMPTDLVAYEEDEGRAADLTNRPGYSRDHTWTGDSKHGALVFTPPALGPIMENTPCLYMHSIAAPNGQQKLGLVAAQCATGNVGAWRVLRLVGGGFGQASWRPGDKLARPTTLGELFIYLQANDRLRLYAGQPDPTNPTRISIRYELNGRTGTIEGILDDSGGFHFRVIDGPIAPSATTTIYAPPKFEE